MMETPLFRRWKDKYFKLESDMAVAKPEDNVRVQKFSISLSLLASVILALSDTTERVN